MSIVESAQFKRGKKYEDYLDRFFTEKGYQIRRTTPYQERVLYLGDRIFERPERRYFVEYKSDESTSRTGNFFVETVSVDTSGKPGWAFTCQADRLLYYLPLDGLIYVLRPRVLREHLEHWRARYPERPTSRNQNAYKSYGVLVPREAFTTACFQVITCHNPRSAVS